MPSRDRLIFADEIKGDVMEVKLRRWIREHPRTRDRARERFPVCGFGCAGEPVVGAYDRGQ
jgi:hypothetical protein